MDWTLVLAVTAVAVPVCTVVWLLNRTTLTNSLAEASKALIKEINGTYVRSAGSKLTGDEIERRLVRIDSRFDQVEIKLDRIVRMLVTGTGNGSTHQRHRTNIEEAEDAAT